MRISQTPAHLLGSGLALSLLACSPSTTGGRTGRAPVTPTGAFDVASYCDLAARADVAAMTGSAAIVCEPATEEHEELPSCRALVAAESGAVSEIEIPNAVAALRAADGRFVVLTSDERLVLHDGRRTVRQLAAWAAEPSLDASGRTVAFVAALDEVERPDIGDPTRLVSLEIASDRLTVLSTDELASAPLFVPDASAVLYVTTASGVASIARVPATGGAAQILTNEGLIDVGQGFVPVYEGEHAWAGSMLVYTARTRDDRPEVWALDTTTGDASRVGEGSHPVAADDGTVLVRDEATGTCPVTISLSVTP